MERCRAAFQSTRPRGARPVAVAFFDDPFGVSIHAPAGGATEITQTNSIFPNVSIHAPAGGATAAGHVFEGSGAVSIHAPAGGATQNQLRALRHFAVSIHAPAGGATKLLKYIADVNKVSIHAPAGGATRPAAAGWLRVRRFNPRARGGRDPRWCARY